MRCMHQEEGLNLSFNKVGEFHKCDEEKSCKFEGFSKISRKECTMKNYVRVSMFCTRIIFQFHYSINLLKVSSQCDSSQTWLSFTTFLCFLLHSRTHCYWPPAGQRKGGPALGGGVQFASSQ